MYGYFNNIIQSYCNSIIKVLSINQLKSFIFLISYPFDWKTPLGYVVCVFIQVITLIAAIDLYVSVVVLTIGFCMLIADFASDIKEKLRQFNRILISSDELTTDDRIVLKKRLSEFIEFHSEARELSAKFNSKQIFLSH